MRRDTEIRTNFLSGNVADEWRMNFRLLNKKTKPINEFILLPSPLPPRHLFLIVQIV